MNATLSFNLPGESAEYIQTISAGRMAAVICGLAENTRGWLKHGHAFATADEAIAAIRDSLLEVLPLATGEL